jgi:hypothetical protein
MTYRGTNALSQGARERSSSFKMVKSQKFRITIEAHHVVCLRWRNSLIQTKKGTSRASRRGDDKHHNMSLRNRGMTDVGGESRSPVSSAKSDAES